MWLWRKPTKDKAHTFLIIEQNNRNNLVLDDQATEKTNPGAARPLDIYLDNNCLLLHFEFSVTCPRIHPNRNSREECFFCVCVDNLRVALGNISAPSYRMVSKTASLNCAMGLRLLSLMQSWYWDKFTTNPRYHPVPRSLTLYHLPLTSHPSLAWVKMWAITLLHTDRD